jgi:L-threonylcarbamoyladenylate synthase
VGEIVIDKAVTGSVSHDAVVKAPGMKYRHYAPDCSVVIIDGDTTAAARYIARHFRPGNRVLCFEEELTAFASFAPMAYGQEENTDSLLAGLFAALRELDDPAIGTVFARCPKGTGKALAVQNRLEKAAGFCRIDATAQPFVLGITGGTGCGKTTLLKAFEEIGGIVMDCDRIYHELLARDEALLTAIENRFPGCVEDGTLNRKKLAGIVFSDGAALNDLNTITHAAVRQEVLTRFHSAPPATPVAIDAIELFDGGLAEICDTTVAITAPEEMRVQRIVDRDQITAEKAKQRLAAQRPQEELEALCDHTLCNNGTQQEFETKCLAFWKRLCII